MPKVLAPAWLLAMLCALYKVSGHTWTDAQASRRLLTAPPLAEADTRLLDIATLGHRGLYDVFANIWLLQILTDPDLRHENPEDVQGLILKVARHAPKIETLYMLSCFVLAFDLRRADLCEPVTLHGLRAFPDSWRIPVTQGVLTQLILRDAVKAALYLQLAASRPEAPPFLSRLLTNLRRDQSIDDTDLEHAIQALDVMPGGSRIGELLRHAPVSAPAANEEP